ncbi:BDNF/NT-3 growth factors receptor-like [Sitophilus oryzae]|uniref:BDNF/NT-3 growth factors receptor-like n=1 Tax=Sitophilus oryzae TaxID=7048 RepID=A0A6J2X1H0_SITOR|nr:BDNF/NT-3 growth factors receptor-like [Sitophilus oryzae]
MVVIAHILFALFFVFDAFMKERIQIFHEGSCSVGKCKGESACKNFANHTYTCVCTHDSLPPTQNGNCPRRLVHNSQIQNGKIPNVQPPTFTKQLRIITSDNHNKSGKMKNHQEGRTNAVTEQVPYLVNFVLPSAVLVACAILFMAVVFYIKLKSKRRNDSAAPMNLKDGLLIPERYAPNPQYSVCSSTDVPVIRKETLKFLNELGEGCFGKVFKGELLKDADTRDIVAIKVLKDSATKEAEEDFFREVEIMSAFQHRNILSFVGVVPREGNVCPMMVFEYMEHGDLAGVLRSQHRWSAGSDDSPPTVPQLSTEDLLGVSLQIAKGMEYLASQRFVHRDLACRNCLVAQGPVVKIADFGMSRDVYTCDYYKIGGSRLLPVRWMSPESVVYGRFTLESDIWSFGIVLWEIYSYAKQPYYGHTNEEVVKLILEGIMLIPPERCPLLICELMKNCWKTEPKHRISFPLIRSILEDAYFNSKGKQGDDREYSLLDKDEPDSQESSGTLKLRNEWKNEIFEMASLDELSLIKRASEMKLKTLPRPPPLPKTVSNGDLVDAQGYLLPSQVKDPVQYLCTLPA